MAEAAGSGAEGAPEGSEGGAEAGEITPPAANTWWQFENQEQAESWANDLVTKRLTRERKTKLDPIVQERDTLKAELETLRPLKEATQTDAERWQDQLATLTAQNQELLSYKQETSRANLVRQIAEEVGLPASLVSHINGDDEDAIRGNATDLLNALSEGGLNPGGKKTPPLKGPKPENDGGGSFSPGGGGNSDEPSEAELIKSIKDEVAAQRRNGGLKVARR